MKIPTFVRVAAVALVLVPSAARAEADEKGYILAKKGHLPAAGIVRSERIVSDLVEAAVEIKAEMRTVPGSYNHKISANVVTEGLAPGKARRTLTSKVTEERFLIHRSEQVSPEESDPLQGLPVIVEYKDGGWTAVLEAGEPDPAQKTALAEMVDELKTDPDVAVYGETPRKPGERWNVDLKTVAQFAGVKSPTGSLAVEFVEVKEIGGINCAVLKTSFDLQGDSITKDKELGMKKKLKGEATIQRSLADFADMEMKAACKFTGEGEISAGATMKIEGPLSVELTATREKP